MRTLNFLLSGWMVTQGLYDVVMRDRPVGWALLAAGLMVLAGTFLLMEFEDTEDTK